MSAFRIGTAITPQCRSMDAYVRGASVSDVGVQPTRHQYGKFLLPRSLLIVRWRFAQPAEATNGLPCSEWLFAKPIRHIGPICRRQRSENDGLSISNRSSESHALVGAF